MVEVSFSWSKETFDSDQFDLNNVDTLHQAADVLTKPFTSPQKWDSALYMLNMVNYTYQKPKGKGNSLAVMTFPPLKTPTMRMNRIRGAMRCPISNPNNNKGLWLNGVVHQIPNSDNQELPPKMHRV